MNDPDYGDVPESEYEEASHEEIWGVMIFTWERVTAENPSEYPVSVVLNEEGEGLQGRLEVAG